MQREADPRKIKEKRSKYNKIKKEYRKEVYQVHHVSRVSW